MFRKNKTDHVCEWQAIAYVKTDINLALDKAIQRVRELHTPTADGRSCIECSRIICLGTSNGLGGIQYPCLTIAMLNGFANEA
jgi:hypothetical protein